jgi:phosphonate transport system substrate-binding protein
MLTRKAVLGLATGLVATLTGFTADAQSWKDEVPVFRYGILGGENEADRLTNYACFQDLLGKELGVPVELYPASDYAGVMQGLIAGTLEAGGLGASAYAGIYIEDPDAVEPIVTQEQTDGSTGYYSVLYVRSDSEMDSLDALKGKSLAFADPNSTTGYLYPAYELKKQGFDPAGHFGSAGFAGGHEQAVIAVLNNQYDAGVTWTSGVGEYTSGNLNKMVRKGALDMDDIKILWKSSLIPNSPEVIRQDLRADLKAAYKDFLVNRPTTDYECFKATQGGDYSGFHEVNHDFYQGVVELRQDQASARRG